MSFPPWCRCWLSARCWSARLPCAAAAGSLPLLQSHPSAHCFPTGLLPPALLSVIIFFLPSVFWPSSGKSCAPAAQFGGEYCLAALFSFPSRWAYSSPWRRFPPWWRRRCPCWPLPVRWAGAGTTSMGCCCSVPCSVPRFPAPLLSAITAWFAFPPWRTAASDLSFCWLSPHGCAAFSASGSSSALFTLFAEH